MVLLLLGLILTCLSGCGRSAPQVEPQVAAPPATISYIMTGDLRAKPQLLSGWYAIEDGAWRWMGKQAEAIVAVPSQPPATFELRLFFPPKHMEKAGGPVTVSILFDGKPFAEETCPLPGQYTLSKPLPVGLLRPPSVKVAIRLSRAVVPSAADQRELGAVVSAFGFK